MPAHAATAFRLALLIFSWLPVPTFAADVRVTLPLEGYFRPGRYMPVRVDVRGAPADARLRLTTEGAVPTDIVLSDGRADGIVPVLPIEAGARQLRWSIADESGVVEAPLREMNPDERLVGFASAVDTALAQRLFPETRIRVVRVDAELTVSRAIAWQALDAVVVPVDYIADDHIRSFLSAGVAVVVASDEKPRGMERLPWQQFDGYRVLRHDAFGPDRAGVSAAAFAPVQGWQAELPKAMRNRLLLYGVLVVVLLLGATLLPRKMATIVVIVICVASAWSMNRWWRTRSPTLERVGSVYVRDAIANQHDLWTYRTARGPVSGEQSFLMTWPILERPGDVRAINLRLECDSRGEVGAFRYDLTRGQRIAFITRSVTFSPMPSAGPIAERGESPMGRLALKLYLRPSYRIVAPEYPMTSEGPGLLREVYPTAVVAPVRDGG